jgi:hypothetical protein
MTVQEAVISAVEPRAEETRLRRLRPFNGIMGALHLVQGILMIALSNDTTYPFFTNLGVTHLVQREPPPIGTCADSPSPLQGGGPGWGLSEGQTSFNCVSPIKNKRSSYTGFCFRFCANCFAQNT